jgi:dopamine beta-monooxygenase
MMPEYQGPCYSQERPEVTKICKRVLAAWAMGALPFSYPEVLHADRQICPTVVCNTGSVLSVSPHKMELFQEAGLPIGGPDFNPYIMLEVHYNNPEKRTGW